MKIFDKRHHIKNSDKHIEDFNIYKAVEFAVSFTFYDYSFKKPGILIEHMPKHIRKLLCKSKAKHYQYRE